MEHLMLEIIIHDDPQPTRHEVRSALMICDVCGASNEEHARFCDRCGSALKAQSTPAATGATINLSSTDVAQRSDQPVGSARSYSVLHSGHNASQPAFRPQQSGTALLALILSLISFLGPYIITAVPAIILGYNARREIRASGGRLTGEGMAQAAIILGWICIGLSMIGLCMLCAMFFALPSLYVGS